MYVLDDRTYAALVAYETLVEHTSARSAISFKLDGLVYENYIQIPYMNDLVALTTDLRDILRTRLWALLDDHNRVINSVIRDVDDMNALRALGLAVTRLVDTMHATSLAELDEATRQLEVVLVPLVDRIISLLHGSFVKDAVDRRPAYSRWPNERPRGI